MNERMDKAYSDFAGMQEKLRRLEQYLDQPHSKRIEYDQLQETYFKLSRDYDEVKGKQSALFEENQRMSRISGRYRRQTQRSKLPASAVSQKITFPGRTEPRSAGCKRAAEKNGRTITQNQRNGIHFIQNFSERTSFSDYLVAWQLAVGSWPLAVRPLAVGRWPLAVGCLTCWVRKLHHDFHCRYQKRI